MLIAFTGKKESGKTASALHLEENFNFYRVNFKDGLVEELKQNFPDLLEYFSAHYDMGIDELFIEKPLGIRRLMQNYGTEVRRKDDENYWILLWKLRAGELILENKNVVVDDVRFLNEAKAVRDLGGTIIRIKRPGKNGDNHISETEMDEIKADKSIINKGTLRELLTKTEQINE